MSDDLEAKEIALALAVADMDEALAALDALGGEVENAYLVRALETAVVVSYARPFTTSYLYPPKLAEYGPEEPSQVRLHDELLRLRQKRYAHTDEQIGRTGGFEITETTITRGPNGAEINVVMEHREQATPLPREAFAAYRSLIEEQRGRFAIAGSQVRHALDLVVPRTVPSPAPTSNPPADGCSGSVQQA